MLSDWNAALHDDVRAKGRRDRRLYLFVDREHLANVSGLDESEALDDFISAFRAEGAGRPFGRGARAALEWRRSGYLGDPPFVAHLAMTVLAVTEESLGSSHGVYRRQNQLLGLPELPAPPNGYGDDVPLMWGVWNHWLEGPGAAFGRPSAKTHPHWTLQGWARSQGLIRHPDRLRIEQFFEDGGCPRVGSPKVADLIAWLTYRGAWAQDLLKRVDDDAAREVLRDVLEDEADRWRKEGTRPRSAGAVRGLLLYDDWTDTLSGAVLAEPAWIGSSVNIGSGGTVTVDALTQYVEVDLGDGVLTRLRDGLRHQLTPTVSVDFGGGGAFVFRDEPALEGRLQARVIDRAAVHHALAHRDRLSEVQAALRAAGIPPPRTKPVADSAWHWLEDIWLDREVPALRALGLGAALPTSSAGLSLIGGLRVGAPATFLAGGEPDVMPHGTDEPVLVRVDRAAVKLGADGLIALAELALDPGSHEVSDGSSGVKFRTVSHMREVAAASAAGRPLRRAPSGRLLMGETEKSPAPPSLSGAQVTGLDIRAAHVIHNPGAECLVLTRDGGVFQVSPLAPRWLDRAALTVDAIDVDAVASRVPDAAYVIARHPKTRGKVAAAYSPSTPSTPYPLLPRPDLIHELVTDNWRWVGTPDDVGARRCLSRALNGRQRGEAPRASRPAATRREQAVRPDLRHERVVPNPYDDVLTWLSEREHAGADRPDVAATWAWVCRRMGLEDQVGDWRLALKLLTDMGHIEQNFQTGRVSPAPATAVALPNARGLFLLTGARPLRLLERLDDPDDGDPIVSEAVCSLTVHYRTPMRRAGRPAGPSTVYLEIDLARVDAVRAGLERLGVLLHGGTADFLLASTPSLREAASAGQTFTHAPGREPVVYRCVNGEWRWLRAADDRLPGLYRYKQGHRRVFVWRDAFEGTMSEVEPAVGQLLARAEEKLPKMWHEHFTDRLFVPRAMALPSMVERALILRTGLPPYLFRGLPPRGGAEFRARVFENVDDGAAELVARALQIPVVPEYEEMRSLDE
ncbi:hypothetical protein GC089_18070 [Cellulomonas sp. JZ18]|nr:hypothetical protein GC089_18070 [Cellulomonas sp. JZ18]